MEEKKSLIGRLKKMVHKEPVEKDFGGMSGIMLDMANKEKESGKDVVYVPVPVEQVSTVADPPASFGITIPASMAVTKELSDKDVEERLADVADKFKEERKVSLKELMKVPGDGSNYTAPKPSKASIEQKRQKAARRLRRKNEK